MSRQKFSKGLKRQIAIEYMQSGKSRQEMFLQQAATTLQHRHESTFPGASGNGSTATSLETG